MPTVSVAPQLPTLSPGMAFDEAARAVLAFLQDLLPMGVWTVTRVENGRQTYLHLDDRAFGLDRGGSHAWQDSFCIRMVSGEGPRIAPDVAGVPVYLDQPVAQALRIGAYVGVPITEQGGGLFGTLCGLDPDPQDAVLREEEGLLELLGQLLGMVLAADRAREIAARAELTARLAAETDPLTGLYNRRAWDDVITLEGERQCKFADPTVVVLVDLDQLKHVNDREGHAAEDRYIRAAGLALREAAGEDAPIARLGGDEFALLLRGTSIQDAGDVVDALYRSLARARVAGSIGWAPYTVIAGFPGAMEQADQRMYAAKRQRRAGRATRRVEPAWA